MTPSVSKHAAKAAYRTHVLDAEEDRSPPCRTDRDDIIVQAIAIDGSVNAMFDGSAMITENHTCTQQFAHVAQFAWNELICRKDAVTC
jgi:hypothetical protein